MKIAVIGWGSLIWNPEDLDVASEWFTDGPLLPVEFAWVSRDGRLTLVLVGRGPVQQTLWAASGKTSLEEAAADLRAREKCDLCRIGAWPRQPDRSRAQSFGAVIARWVAAKRLGGAVWTALGSTDLEMQSGWASNDERLEYLRGLIKTGSEAAAREYIVRAPVQIRTPFRELVRRELGWK